MVILDHHNHSLSHFFLFLIPGREIIRAFNIIKIVALHDANIENTRHTGLKDMQRLGQPQVLDESKDGI